MSDGCRFGAWEIRPGERTILFDGKRVLLKGRAFDLLVALMDRRDRVVPRAELYEAVWGQRVVEDGNLDVQVHAIRKLLGKQALVTVPGRGYRFALGSSDPSAVVMGPGTSDSTGEIPPLPAGLFGRDDDLITLDGLLAEHRLITVVGAGGIGKTTLAVAAAHRRRPMLRDSVAWVDASPIRDAILLLQAAARAFDLAYAGSIVSLAAFAKALESTRALLVIDNAEHLVEAVAQLTSELILRAPRIKILVTSQAALRLPGEQVFRLAPLSVPDRNASFAEAERHGAVQLFSEAARAVDHRFKLDERSIVYVVSLCRRLDGLPLAIKLAAARVPFLGVRGLESRLSNRFALIGGGYRNAPTRQQTLRAALDWSYSLLSPDEKIVLHRLAVFVGTFDLDFAVAVVQCERLDKEQIVEGLASLVERSIAVASDSDPVRYRLLESTREYADQKLAAGPDASVVQRRHARAAAELISRLDEQSWRNSEEKLLQTFVDEIDSIRTALEWSIDHDHGTAVELMGASIHFFTMISLILEVSRYCTRIDPLVDDVSSDSDVARYWMRRSQSMGSIDHLAKYRFARKATAICRRMGNNEELCLAITLMLGSGQVPPREANGLLKEVESIPWRNRPTKFQAFMEGNLAAHGFYEGLYSRAAEGWERAAILAARSGMPGLNAMYTALAAQAHFATGNVIEPLERCQKTFDREQQRRYGMGGLPLGFLGVGQLMIGRIADARASFDSLFGMLHRISGLVLLNMFGEAFVLLALNEGRHKAAACLLGYAEKNTATLGLTILNSSQMSEARALLEQSVDPETLRRLLTAGRSLSPDDVCTLTLAASDADDFIEAAIGQSVQLRNC